MKFGGAKVRRLPGLSLLEQRRFQRQREIVIQELTEERDPSRHVRIVGIIRVEDGRICNRLDRISEEIQCAIDSPLDAELFRLLSCLVGRHFFRCRVPARNGSKETYVNDVKSDKSQSRSSG